MVLAALAALVGATIQSATGFGFALVVGPAFFFVFDPGEAITALLTLGVLLGVLVLGTERRVLSVKRRELAGSMVTALPGIALGVLIISAISKPALQVIVGAGVLVAVIIQLSQRSPERAAASGFAQTVAGFSAGVLTTTTGANGPPLLLMLERMRATPAELRDTLAAAFVILGVIGLAMLLVAGDAAAYPGAWQIAALVAITIAGHAAGKRLFEMMRPATFRAAGITLVVAAGVASIVAGLLA